jgi:hypothetical protein
VFAPTDAAFEKLPKATLEKLAEDKGSILWTSISAETFLKKNYLQILVHFSIHKQQIYIYQSGPGGVVYICTYVVVSSPYATEDTGAKSRKIESRQGLRW